MASNCSTNSYTTAYRALYQVSDLEHGDPVLIVQQNKLHFRYVVYVMSLSSRMPQTCSIGLNLATLPVNSRLQRFSDIGCLVYAVWRGNVRYLGGKCPHVVAAERE